MKFGTKLKLKKEWKKGYLTFPKGEILNLAFYDHKYGLTLCHPQVRGTLDFPYSPQTAKDKIDEYFEVIQDMRQEDIIFIKSLSKEMREQDNRATAQPYALIIGNEQRVITDWEFSCDGKAIHWDECEYDNIEEFKSAVLEYYGDTTQEEVKIINECEDIDNLRYAENRINSIMSPPISTYAYNIETSYNPNHHCLGNFFLTEKSAKEYIKANRHNLGNKPHTYGIHLYRNPEMERLYDIIHKLADML